jgi:hypothetical protein
MKHQSLNKANDIKAKKICPYLKTCSQKSAACPSKGNTKTTPHSCGFARLFAKRVSKPVTPPETPQSTPQIEMVNLSDVVAQKQAERAKPQTWIPQHEIANYAR